MILICGSTLTPSALPMSDMFEYKLITEKSANIALKSLANNKNCTAVYAHEKFESLILSGIANKTKLFKDDEELLSQLKEAAGIPDEKPNPLVEQVKARLQAKQAASKEVNEGSAETVASATPVADDTWTCPACGATGITAKFCGECGAKRPEAESKVISEDKPVTEVAEEEPVIATEQDEPVDIPEVVEEEPVMTAEQDEPTGVSETTEVIEEEPVFETDEPTVTSEIQSDSENSEPIVEPEPEIDEPLSITDIEEEPEQVVEPEDKVESVEASEPVPVGEAKNPVDDDIGFQFSFEDESEKISTDKVEASSANELNDLPEENIPSVIDKVDDTEEPEIAEPKPEESKAGVSVSTAEIEQYKNTIAELEEKVKELERAKAEIAAESNDRVAKVRESLLKDQAVLQDTLDNLKKQHSVEMEDKDNLIKELQQNAQTADMTVDSEELERLKTENHNLKFKADAAYDEMEVHKQEFEAKEAEYAHSISILQEQLMQKTHKLEEIDSATSVLRMFDKYTQNTKIVIDSMLQSEDQTDLRSVDGSDIILFSFGAGESTKVFLTDIQRRIINGDDSILIIDLTLEVLLVFLNKGQTAQEFTRYGLPNFDLSRELRAVGKSNSAALFAGPQLDLGFLTYDWGNFLTNVKNAAKGKKVLLLLPSIASFNVAQAFVRLTTVPNIKAYIGVNGDTYALQQAIYFSSFLKKGKFSYIVANGDTKQQKLLLKLKESHDMRIFKDGIMFNQLGL